MRSRPQRAPYGIDHLLKRPEPEEHRTPNPKMPKSNPSDVRCSALDVRCRYWMSDVRCWMLMFPLVQVFETETGSFSEFSPPSLPLAPVPSAFGFRPSFGLRPSDFGLRPSSPSRHVHLAQRPAPPTPSASSPSTPATSTRAWSRSSCIRRSARSCTSMRPRAGLAGAPQAHRRLQHPR